MSKSVRSRLGFTLIELLVVSRVALRASSIAPMSGKF